LPKPRLPIKHRLRDCGMMKNVVASRSLAQGMEVDEVSDEVDRHPFLDKMQL
jgi:hypothetical protein